MGDRKNEKAKDDSAVRDYFNSLNLERWKISGNSRDGGQAETIEVRDKQSNARGVFRVLRRQNSVDKKRFHRELRVLSKIKHQNVIEILDSPKTTDEYWYISKRGEQFKSFWDKRCKKLKANPNELLLEAIDILKGIAAGLEQLHKKNIVHRDIKASNVVMNGNVPVLIDFGIVFVMGEERFTPIDRTVANKFSHDLTLHFMETVPKWLDVFLLSQLLIWMISETTQKRVERPLDWRFVVYPEFSDINKLRVKALTGKCSDPAISPKDASEFKKLVNDLFPTASEEMTQTKNMENIHAIIRKANLDREVGSVEARPIIESALPLFVIKFEQLESQLRSLMSRLSNPVLKIKLEDNIEFVSDFSRKFHGFQGDLPAIFGSTITYRIGEGWYTSFAVKVEYWCYTQAGTKDFPRYKFLENRPFAVLHLHADNDTLNGPRIRKFKTYHLVIDSAGILNVCDIDKKSFEPISIEEIVDLVSECIADEEAWQVLYE